MLLGVLATARQRRRPRCRPSTARQLGNTEAVGLRASTATTCCPFEIVSVVLLVAMIGAIVFGRRDAALEPPDREARP